MCAWFHHVNYRSFVIFGVFVGKREGNNRRDDSIS